MEYQKYLNDIERFFCLVRASGFALSPRDSEKVRQWYVKGVPIRVILDGIVKGAREFRFKAAPGEVLPHHLSFYSHFIGGAVRNFRREPPSEAPAARPDDATPELQPILKHLLAEIELLCVKEERQVEARALDKLKTEMEALAVRAVEQKLDEQALAYRVQVLDENTLSFYDGILEEGTRAELRARAAREVSGTAGLSARALQRRRDARFQALLRERLGLLDLVQ